MNQVLVCLKNKDKINFGVLDKRQKELVTLGNVIRSGKTDLISRYVKEALDSGATKEDILRAASFILGDKKTTKYYLSLSF